MAVQLSDFHVGTKSFRTYFGVDATCEWRNGGIVLVEQKVSSFPGQGPKVRRFNAYGRGHLGE